VVLSHAREDRHQDHRTVSDLTWNTWRDALVLEYEIPKYDGDLRGPNLFVPLEEPVVERKLDHLARHFPSQHEKPWYDADTFRGLLRLRGVECQAPSRFAEAFYARKLVLG
jgi:LmbE family N-acetylglucosaminyl deacetylase